MTKILRSNIKRSISIIFLFLFLFAGCWHSLYKIDIENTEDIKTTIIDTERLIKKIEILSKYTYYSYPIFRFENNGITMIYTKVNYNSNDSIREGRSNPNTQNHIDTCQVIPGLTIDEWTLLKINLKKLENIGIKSNNVAFYNEEKLEFFYYSYLYPDNWEYCDIGYLALLSEDIVNTDDFKQRFTVMDEKDGIYLIKIIR